jgi:hypothetical protein
MVEDLGVANLEVRRWKRYGKDRLYVRGPDGEAVGWVDLLSGRRTVSDPTNEAAFSATVDDWYLETTQCRDASTAKHRPTPALTPRPAEPRSHDLTTHVAGQGVRLQATRELAAMKERSRVGTVIARTFDAKTEERSWRIGAEGEETVGRRLDSLTNQGWHVLHAVPVGKQGSDIDHVLVGPGGVFTVNTKNHPGGRVWVASHAIRVNGHPVRYLPKSRHEGERAHQLLSRAAGFAVPVQPVLILLTGTLIPNVTIKQRPEGVWILDRMDVPSAFRRTRNTLSAADVGAIFNAARQCTTWTGFAGCRCTASA